MLHIERFQEKNENICIMFQIVKRYLHNYGTKRQFQCIVDPTMTR